MCCVFSSIDSDLLQGQWGKSRHSHRFALLCIHYSNVQIHGYSSVYSEWQRTERANEGEEKNKERKKERKANKAIYVLLLLSIQWQRTVHDYWTSNLSQIFVFPCFGWMFVVDHCFNSISNSSIQRKKK